MQNLTITDEATISPILISPVMKLVCLIVYLLLIKSPNLPALLGGEISFILSSSIYYGIYTILLNNIFFIFFLSIIMKKEFSINYLQRNCKKTGTSYDQTINITHHTREKLNNILISEEANKTEQEDCMFYAYLFTDMEREGNIVFMNLTQRNFFNRWLKLPLKGRNTCFCIID